MAGWLPRRGGSCTVQPACQATTPLDGGFQPPAASARCYENGWSIARSDWHFHPGHDTYGYLTEGRRRVEYDAEGDGVEIGPGGFVLIPAGVPHREGNPGDVPNAGTLFRVVEGPVLVPLDHPPAASD